MSGNYAVAARRALAAILMLALAPMAQTAPNLPATVERFKGNDPGSAIADLQALVKRGDRTALFYLASAYFQGKGVEKDLATAARMFSDATDLGDPNAPVWAGMAFEAMGDIEASARLHRIALERARHKTSILALARFHLANRIAGANPAAAVRYFAHAQSFRNQFEPNNLEGSYLTKFSCFELMQAAYLQDASKARTGQPSIRPYTDALRDCVENGKTSFELKLVAAADAEAASGGPIVIDEFADFFNLLPSNSDTGVRVLPGTFNGFVAFASDADSADADAQFSLHRYLNDALGLPIASSTFALLAGDREAAKDAKISRLSSFFSESETIDTTPIDGEPKFFALARAWHRGRFDHFHSWYDGGDTFLLRPMQKSLAEPIEVDIGELVRADGPNPNRYYRNLVLRLYFSGKIPEDTRIEFVTNDARGVAVNSAQLVAIQRTELDENVSRFTLPFSFPIRFPMVDIDPEEEIAFAEVGKIAIKSPACGSSCNVSLEKIEVGVFDRAVALSQWRWLRRLNIYPYGYTSHGGERWDIHGDETLTPKFWRNSAAATAQPGLVHHIEGFTLANVPASKGYLEDLLSELRVRAVRPSGLRDNRPALDAVHDWAASPKLFGLFHDKMNFATTHFFAAPTTEAFLDEQADFLATTLGDEAQHVGPGCIKPGCNISHTSMLPALVLASIVKARRDEPEFSHAWYTHFGAPNSSFQPTPERPITAAGVRAFERLAGAHYGFDQDGKPTTDPRLLVVPSTRVLRARKLKFLAGSGLLGIVRKNNTVEIESTVDPFTAAFFPDRRFPARDLAGLSFAVDNVFEAAVSLDRHGVLPLVRRLNPADTAGPSGEISVVDTTTPHTLIFPAFAGADSTIEFERAPTDERMHACASPVGNRALYNAAYLGFDNPFAGADAGGDLEIVLTVRGHSQRAFSNTGGELKRHVFTSLPASVDESAMPTTVHRVDLPGRGGRQPDVVYIDLAMPAAYRPGAGPAIGALNVNGTVEKVCVSLTTRGDEPPGRFGPTRFYRHATGDVAPGETGVVVGGRFDSTKLRGGGKHLVLEFRDPDSGRITSFGARAGYYFGKLAQPGYYEAAIRNERCDGSDRTPILVESDTLGIDWSADDCTLRSVAQ